VGKYRAKQFDILTKTEKEIGNSRLQHKKRRKSKESKNKHKKVVVMK
jgi:hypothetical protein